MAAFYSSTPPETYDIWYDPAAPDSWTYAPDNDPMGVLILAFLGLFFIFGPPIAAFRSRDRANKPTRGGLR